MIPFLFGYNVYAESIYDQREKDWRNGALVYQVIVDRFAPSQNLEAKEHLYVPPKMLRSWDEVPEKGEELDEVKVWSHEIEFWGGDLDSLTGKLDYVDQLGIDVLYLNPIHQAYTNHKYDAQDYFEVSEEYGTREDVVFLAEETEERGMQLVLDGVLNHMGRTSPYFQEALKNPESKWQEWYYINTKYPAGYRAWYNVPNLPEINLESQAVRDRLWNDPDSLIQGYIRDGVDGWRLDVAFDIGYNYLRELTDAAHLAKSDALVIGEIWNYPPEWFEHTDAVMNMTQRELILSMLRGQVEPRVSKMHMDRLVRDSNYEALLRSWVMLDNHDTSRLRTVMPEPWQQRLAQALQFTLPGSPCIYYGVELGMEGGEDPEQRAPMRWDLVAEDNRFYQWFRKLVTIRKENRALVVGDYVELDTKVLFGFMRKTDSVDETVLIIVNPTGSEVTEFLMPRESKWMSGTQIVDQLTGQEFTVFSGTSSITVPPHTAYILKAEFDRTAPEYSPYKRVP